LDKYFGNVSGPELISADALAGKGKEIAIVCPKPNEEICW
jgi:hypothetical protein